MSIFTVICKTSCVITDWLFLALASWKVGLRELTFVPRYQLQSRHGWQTWPCDRVQEDPVTTPVTHRPTTNPSETSSGSPKMTFTYTQ